MQCVHPWTMDSSKLCPLLYLLNVQSSKLFYKTVRHNCVYIIGVERKYNEADMNVVSWKSTYMRRVQREWEREKEGIYCFITRSNGQSPVMIFGCYFDCSHTPWVGFMSLHSIPEIYYIYICYLVKAPNIPQSTELSIKCLSPKCIIFRCHSSELKHMYTWIFFFFFSFVVVFLFYTRFQS